MLGKSNLPSKIYRNNSSLVLSNTKENRLSKIKMLERRVTPTTIIVW